MDPYISESIRNNLIDLKENYIREYGPVASWSEQQKDIFFLNCDVELDYVLKYFRIEPHENCQIYGLTYGLMILQTVTTENYLENKGFQELNRLDIYSREELNRIINNVIYDYIVHGIE
jgi:hypothetical protein